MLPPQPFCASVSGDGPGHPVHVLVAILGIVAALVLGADGALAQSRTRIFDIEIGTLAGALPQEEFVEPACGTNGGPPSLPLAGFESFGDCPVEEETGLRETWFIYDDEWEYIARAQRDETIIRRYSANSFFGQPIITSLLFDDAGLVQGYRVVTDSRAPPEVRIEGYLLFGILKSMFSAAPWMCTALPPYERERPIEGWFLNQSCNAEYDGKHLRVEGRHMFKPGQDLRINPRNLDAAEGEFESSARLDVYSADAVRDAPCCRASTLR